MKTNLEELSPVKRKISIEIESNEIDKKLDEAYRKVGKTAKVPGFRPKKAPREILERHFGDQVIHDVTNDLINETFPKALEEADIFPLGTPLLEKDTLKQGQNFKYSATIEIRPQFEIDNYLGVEAEKETCSVTEEDVRKRLEQIREANGTLVSIDQERPIQKDDYVVIDYEGFEDNKPLEDIKSSNFILKVGSNDFHPKLEEAVIGLNKKDEVEIPVDFEDSFHHSNLAGKSMDLKVNIVDIKEMKLPELNDEFIQNLGADFKTIKDLEDKVRETTILQEEKRIDTELKQRLMTKILDTVDFELPEVLVKAELDYAIGNLNQNLIRSGSNIEKAGLSDEKLRKEFRPGSEKRVKEMLVLGEIAKREKIEVDEHDMEESFKELASTMGQPPEAIRQYYEARNLGDSLRGRLLEEKTLNYLVEHAKLHEVGKDDLEQNGNSKNEEN